MPSSKVNKVRNELLSEIFLKADCKTGQGKRKAMHRDRACKVGGGVMVTADSRLYRVAKQRKR